MAKNRGED